MMQRIKCMMKVKRLRVLSLLFAVLLSGLALSSCVSRLPERTPEPATEAEAEIQNVPVELSDGWVLNTEFSSTLTDAEAGLLLGAMLEFDPDFEYRPVALIANQIVAGTNRAYLCQGSGKTETGASLPISFWIVTVYEDLAGNASVTRLSPLDPSAIRTTPLAPQESPAVGAWQIKRPQYEGVLTKESEDALEKAFAANGGFEYCAIATLSSREDNTAYRLLLETEEAEEPRLCVVTVEADPSGAFAITENARLDLSFYTQN